MAKTYFEIGKNYVRKICVFNRISNFKLNVLCARNMTIGTEVFKKPHESPRKRGYKYNGRGFCRVLNNATIDFLVG